MKLRGCKILLFLFCFGHHFLFANIITQNFDVTNGLIGNAVRCLYEDPMGRLWVGTEGGISVYNGYSFRSITEGDGLCGNRIWAIAGDKKGGKWVACFGKGLTYINNGTFTTFNESDGLTSLKIYALYYWKDALFIGTVNGLFVLEEGAKRIKKISSKKANIFQFILTNTSLLAVGRHTIYRIKPDGNKAFQCIKVTHSSKGITKLIPNNNGFLVSTFKGTYWWPSLKMHSDKLMSKNIVWDFMRTPTGLYFATWNHPSQGGGIYKMEGEKMQPVNSYLHVSSHQTMQCLELRNGTLVFGTVNKGIFLVNPQFLSIQKYPLKNILGQVYYNSKTLYYNDKQLMASSGEVVFQLQYDAIIQKYKEEDIPPKKLRYFGYQKNSTKILEAQATDKGLLLATTAGIILLSKEYTILKAFPLLSHHFCYYDSSLAIATTLDSLKIFSNFLSTHPKDLYPSFSRFLSDNVIRFQPLDSILAVWTASKNIYFIQKDSLLLDSEQLKLKTPLKYVGVWKDWFIMTSANNKVFKGYFVNGRPTFNKAPLSVRFKNIVSASTNGDNYILQTNYGVYVNLVGTIRNFNRDNFFKDKRLTKIFVGGHYLYIYTKKAVYRIPLVDLIDYHLPLPSIHIYGFSQTVIPYSQEMTTLNIEKIATLLPTNFEYYFSVNHGDTIPISGNKLFLSNLSSGDYTIHFLVYNNYNTTWSKIKTLSFSKALPLWTRLIFWVGIFFFLALIFVFFFFRRKLRIKKQEIKKKEIEQRITNLKLEAIRAKMNPHFMFNALNSIQNFVIDEDVDNALMYLSEFSKLMRQTLEFSSQKRITIEEEMEYLNRYVSIEQMRFSCQIKVQQVIPKEVMQWEIPSMILQPLVENAFVHGISDNSEELQEIEVVMKREAKDKLYICISNSTYKKEKMNSKKHPSFALNAVKERLALNNPRNTLTIYPEGNQFSIEIELYYGN